MMSDAHSAIACFPTEVLIKIFTYLPGKNLVKCREVSVRWNNIIRDICISNTLWHNYCRNEFREIYQIAKLKARPQLQWFQVYKSLFLWPNLGLTKGIGNGSSRFENQANDLLLDEEQRIISDYLRYEENEELIVTLHYNLQLQIIVKAQNANHEISSVIDNVKYFLLVRSDVYYVALNDEIGVSVSDSDGLLRTAHTSVITHVADGVMTLGFTNTLNILTYRRHICCLIGDELIEVCCLDKSSNALDQLRHFNLLEHLDWQIYFQWMYRCRSPSCPGGTPLLPLNFSATDANSSNNHNEQ